MTIDEKTLKLDELNAALEQAYQEEDITKQYELFNAIDIISKEQVNE